MKNHIAIAFVVVLALLLPELASACPMCMIGGGNQRAFAIGSLFLSITPLAAIGSAVWYVRRRARAIAAAEAEAAAVAQPTHPAQVAAPR